MKTVITSVFLLMSSFVFSQIPTFNWVKQLTYPGFGSVTGINYMTTDAVGNAYIVGDIQGTVDINPGTGVMNVTSAGSSDIFIEKISPAGTLVWAKTIGGTGQDFPNYVELDSAGNLYITGAFQSTVDFNPGSGTTNLTSAGSGDIFLLKLDNSGNYVFSRRFGGTGNENGAVLKRDVNGNIYLSGSFYSPSISFSGHTINFLGNFDSFLVKLDPAGTATWAKAFWAETNDMVLDDTANIYITGQFFGSNVDLDPGAGTYYMSATGGSSDKDFFILKLNTNGDFMWVKNDGSSNYNDAGTGIAIDSQGNVISSMDKNNAAVELDKWSPGGTYTYLNMGGDVLGTSSFHSSKLIIDAADNILLSGVISGGIDWNFNQGSLFGFSDVYVEKFTNAGSPITGYQIVIGSSLVERFKAFSVDFHGGIYVIGSFQGTVDFNYSTSAINNLTSIGSDDIFILKLAQPTLGEENMLNLKPEGIWGQPNPFSTSLTLQLGDISKLASVEIYDVDGKLMYQNKNAIPSNSLHINTEAWKAGIYFVNSINTNGAHFSSKFIKE